MTVARVTVTADFFTPSPTPNHSVAVMSLNSLNDLFLEELRDLYNAENQLLKALPAMENAAHSAELKIAFNEHLEQTYNHVQRLEAIFETLNESPKGKTCKAMKGLIAESRAHIKEHATSAVKDASLIAAAQRIEHYEISGYGTARTFAETLGYMEAAEILQLTLNEEGATDERLTHLAKALNLEAMVTAESFTRAS
jgi:ferritin-like metal-binding protein YciE